MRVITATLVLLLGVGYLASVVQLPDTVSHGASGPAVDRDQWRRTQSGWERQAGWGWTAKHAIPEPAAWRIHPLTIASLQVLISLFALLLAYPGPVSQPAPLTPQRAWLPRPYGQHRKLAFAPANATLATTPLPARQVDVDADGRH